MNLMKKPLPRKSTGAANLGIKLPAGKGSGFHRFLIQAAEAGVPRSALSLEISYPLYKLYIAKNGKRNLAHQVLIEHERLRKTRPKSSGN
ncbi:MAG TPA: hypothetical protein VJG83_06695 [archaeon]|nr:hypothetical protein [archaeon]